MSREDVAEEIRKQLAEGIEVTGDDFAGWECATCETLIPFSEVLHDRDAVVVWDIEEADPGDPPTGYWHRYYFCSEECRREAKHAPNEVMAGAESDVIEERGVPVIAEAGDVLDAEPGGVRE